MFLARKLLENTYINYYKDNSQYGKLLLTI